MRSNTFFGQVIAVLSRRAPAFEGKHVVHSRPDDASHIHPRAATFKEYFEFLGGDVGRRQMAGSWYGVGAGIGVSIGVAGIILLLVVLL